VKDDLGVLRLIAKHAKPEDIPPEYASELNYNLARYYYLNALEAGARGVEVEQSTEQADDTPAAAEPPPEEEKKEEGGFDFSDGGGGQDEGFDFSEPEATKKPKKAAKPPVDKPKKGKKPKDEPAPAEPAVEKPAAPPPTKGTKNENPASADDNLKLALNSLNRVDPAFPQYAKALYLKGLAHFGLGDFDPAVKAFREVVRLTNPRGGSVQSPRLREMAFFSLARIHYSFEQFRYALFYYERIDRDSEAWLDSLFESSWAHFRLGEYEKALGNLVTIQSPFFIDEYYPESSMLKAITFYENCRYPEARAFLGEFSQNYAGVMKELDRLVGEKRTPEQVYEELAKLEGKVADGRDDSERSSAITARLVRLAVSDKRVAAIRDAIGEVDDEKTRILALSEPFNGMPEQQELIEKIDQRRRELVSAAGGVLSDKLTAELTFLKELKSQLTRIMFEITKQEKGALENKLSNTEQTIGMIPYNFTTATDDERVYWPFEGEYWRDELGTYQYTLTRGCKPPAEGQ
jgi:tetratricopeptide (TPR) repeat protein